MQKDSKCGYIVTTENLSNRALLRCEKTPESIKRDYRISRGAGGIPPVPLCFLFKPNLFLFTFTQTEFFHE